jgi:KDO2-lipid IV(A) lauroyltransferase
VVRTFAAYASCLAEGLASARPEAIGAVHRVVGQEHFERAFERRRGVVIVTAHVGPWDAAGPLLAKVAGGRTVVVAMRREPDARARELHDVVRERSGVRVQHVGDHPLDGLPLLRELRRDGVVAVQLDRVPSKAQGVAVELFGSAFSVPRGPFVLGALARSPILPLFVRRIGYFCYEFEIAPPIDLPQRPTEHEIVAAARQAAQAMERFIKASPTQWFNFEPANP